jgi:acyl-CoA thioester hydrolase
MMHESLGEFNSIIEIQVAWGEMDAARHVNNIMYLRYGESSRIAYMIACGIPFDFGGKGIILAEINCKYKHPLTFPDKIWVGTRTLIDSFDDYSFWTEQVIISQKYNRLCAVINAKLVCYDFELLQKSQLTDVDKKNIISFETKEH